ncbi:MAG: hypothetical protein MK086_11985 [Flavobacteriales bacterium]|nr:hypothetical protein [Flavobacteriales bacterium]
MTVAIISYLVHLCLIFLVNQGILPIESKFFKNPIAAIYTPFSFILIYEVYLLIYYLPKSISYYIGKQYEIITLIVIRRIFKDISHLELTSDWFTNQDDLQFTFDVATALLLFLAIYFFYKNIHKRSSSEKEDMKVEDQKLLRFINLKKTIAVLLVPILVILALFTAIEWIFAACHDYQNGVLAFKNINSIFYDEFFSILIIVDVLLLLMSFFLSDQFHKIIRNSGFVISTILIKVSFSVDGLINDSLLIGSILFGLGVLLIHNMYEKENIEPKM